MANRARRQRMWFPFGSGSVSVVGSASAVINLSNVHFSFFPESKDFTIVRIRAHVEADATVVSAGMLVDFGITVVSLQAFTIGPTATPDPEDDDADWMWYGTLRSTVGEGREFAAGSFAAIPKELPIDNRSMRKVQASESRLVLVVKNRSANVFEYSVEGRYLVLLH